MHGFVGREGPVVLEKKNVHLRSGSGRLDSVRLRNFEREEVSHSAENIVRILDFLSVQCDHSLLVRRNPHGEPRVESILVLAFC